MAKTVDELLREIELSKAASDKSESSSPSTEDEELSSAISKIIGKGKGDEETSESESSGSSSKKSACVKTSSALEDIEKLAAEVQASQYNELIKEAQLLGAAFMDGVMLREQEWAEAIGEAEKTAADKELEAITETLQNDPEAYEAFMKGAEDAETEEAIVETLENDPEAYAAFMKGAADAKEEESSGSSDEEESEEESSSKTAADVEEAIVEALENDPEAYEAFMKGAQDAEAEKTASDEDLEAITETLQSDPEAYAAFMKGAQDAEAESLTSEDALAQKIASDPQLLNEALKEASEDPLAMAGWYLGSPDVPLDRKADILEEAYKEAEARGDQEAVEDLTKIANDLVSQAAEDPLALAGWYLGSPDVPLDKKADILEEAYKEAAARGDQEAMADLTKIAEELGQTKVASDVFNNAVAITNGIIEELRNS